MFRTKFVPDISETFYTVKIPYMIRNTFAGINKKVIHSFNSLVPPKYLILDKTLKVFLHFVSLF